MVVVGITVTATASAQDASTLGQQVSTLIFGEIDYREREDQGDDGFVVGQGVAQFNVRLDDRFSVFTEMTATARKDQNSKFEIERLFVRYDFSDQYKISAGRYHTPLGYWNSAFHHGSWLQTTVSRPETVKFGSNVIPVHFVGALLEGNIGDSDFGYKVGYGNGRSDKINAPGDVGDSNNSRAWMVAGHYRPPGRLGLHTGFSFYIDEINREFEPEIDEQLFGVYLALEREAPEVVVEYTYANHESSLNEGKVSRRTARSMARWLIVLRAEPTSSNRTFAQNDLTLMTMIHCSVRSVSIIRVWWQVHGGTFHRLPFSQPKYVTKSSAIPVVEIVSGCNLRSYLIPAVAVSHTLRGCRSTGWLQADEKVVRNICLTDDGVHH